MYHCLIFIIFPHLTVLQDIDNWDILNHWIYFIQLSLTYKFLENILCKMCDCILSISSICHLDLITIFQMFHNKFHIRIFQNYFIVYFIILFEDKRFFSIQYFSFLINYYLWKLDYLFQIINRNYSFHLSINLVKSPLNFLT